MNRDGQNNMSVVMEWIYCI